MQLLGDFGLTGATDTGADENIGGSTGVEAGIGNKATYEAGGSNDQDPAALGCRKCG